MKTVGVVEGVGVIATIKCEHKNTVDANQVEKEKNMFHVNETTV